MHDPTFEQFTWERQQEREERNHQLCHCWRHGLVTLDEMMDCQNDSAWYVPDGDAAGMDAEVLPFDEWQELWGHLAKVA